MSPELDVTLVPSTDTTTSPTSSPARSAGLEAITLSMRAPGWPTAACWSPVRSLASTPSQGWATLPVAMSSSATFEA